MSSETEIQVITAPLTQYWRLFRVHGAIRTSDMRPPEPLLVLLLLDCSDSLGAIDKVAAQGYAVRAIGGIACGCRRSDRIAVGLVGLTDLVTEDAAPTAEEWGREEVVGQWIGRLDNSTLNLVGQARNRGTWLTPPITACLNGVGQPSHCLVTGDGQWFDAKEAARLLGDSAPVAISRSFDSGIHLDALNELTRPALGFVGSPPLAYYNGKSFVVAEQAKGLRLGEPAFAWPPHAGWHLDVSFIGTEDCIPMWRDVRLNASEFSPDDDGLTGLRQKALVYLEESGLAVDWSWDLQMARRIADAGDLGTNIKETCANPDCSQQVSLEPRCARCPSCNALPFCRLTSRQQQSAQLDVLYVILDEKLPDTQEPKRIVSSSDTPLPDYGVIRLERGFKAFPDQGEPQELGHSTVLANHYLLLNVIRPDENRRRVKA
jgi:hypothetical protein